MKLFYLIKLLNKHTTISRKEIYKLLPHVLDTSTVDNYRNHLCLAGYLKIVGLGKYERIKEIPKNLTTTQLLYQAYPQKYFHKLAPKRIVLTEKHKKSKFRTGY